MLTGPAGVKVKEAPKILATDCVPRAATRAPGAPLLSPWSSSTAWRLPMVLFFARNKSTLVIAVAAEGLMSWAARKKVGEVRLNTPATTGSVFATIW